MGPSSSNKLKEIGTFEPSLPSRTTYQSDLETESTKPKLEELEDSIEIPPFSENIITAMVPETVDVAETGVIEPSEI